jgi:hypothetical protein
MLRELSQYAQEGRGSILGRGKILLFSTASIQVLGTTQQHILWVSGALSLGVKRWGINLLSSIAKAKNGGAMPPLPPIYVLSGD